MPDSRRSLHLALATLAALLGLQLASCADIQATDRSAGVPTAGAATQTAQVPVPGVTGIRTPMPPAPVTGGPLVALLLPLTGRQGGAAAAVRDGFLTAYYSLPAPGRPDLRIYDTGQLGIPAALGQATQDGAGFIVGPLTREEVTAASNYRGPRPPLLTLNALTGAAPAGNALYQFALSPEEEARQVARRVVADGNRAGVALVPDGEWGRRVLAAFTQELNAAGGQLLDAATYDAAGTDYAAAISQVLRLNESEARARRLESVLGARLTFQQRRRGDVGFIFSPGQARAERLLRPQLKFYFAGDVPTYATADAFEPDSNANQDLDGLIFPDAPWLLGGALVDGVRDALNAAWPAGGPPRSILFAFGFDAARMAMALRSLPAAAGSATSLAVDGLTGHLTVAADGHVLRDLLWAQIRNGEPRLLN
ncbi:MAG TPA: penicillin-binding protein activator [Steroidobacteraceae bacterium]|nr:penicillin-binding protein activator [Steroidobacteraceae bacterium]